MFRKTTALVLVVFVVLSVLVGCGQTSSKDSINVLVGPEPQTIDPGLNSSTDGGVYIMHAFEGLTRVDKNGKTAPGIAKKWDISEDGLTYTFYLRDAKWSDGQPVKAQDFEYAWKRALDPNTLAMYSYQLYYLKNGEAYNMGEGSADDVGVKAKDDKTLIVTLAAPVSYFLDLTHFYTYMPLREDILKKYGDQWTLKPETYVCNGAYTMTEWKSKDEIVFQKNEKYWDKGGIILKEIRWELMDDDAAALSAFESGDLDLVYGLIPQAETQNLIRSGKAKVYDLIGTYLLLFNTAKPPLNDAKVRKALAYAMDRTYITEKVTMAGQKPADAFVPYTVPGLDSKKDFRTEGGAFLSPAINADEAKKLLAEAGYPDGKGFPEIEMVYNTQDGNKKIMEVIQEQWKQTLGITVKPPSLEWKVLLEMLQNKEYTISRMGFAGDYNDPMTFLDMWTTNSMMNMTNWSNPKYDELIATAKSTNDQDIRMKALHDAEKILMDEMPACPMYYFVSVVLENPNLKGKIVDSLGFVYFHYAYVQ